MTPTPPPADAKLMPCANCNEPTESDSGICERCSCRQCGGINPSGHMCHQPCEPSRVDFTRPTPPAAPAEDGYRPCPSCGLDTPDGYNFCSDQCREIADLRAEVERLRGERDAQTDKAHISLDMFHEMATAHESMQQERDRLAAELAAMTKERDEVLNLAYMGDHRHVDLSWKARAHELLEELAALKKMLSEREGENGWLGMKSREYESKFQARTKELDAVTSELAALKAGAVTEEQVETVYQHLKATVGKNTSDMRMNSVGLVLFTISDVRAALEAALVSHTTPSPPCSP